ncbi:MAG: glycosyltransferase involved in cell wall biosynthesis [Arenicella sp.]|jgi:glycosyltransferase involved in cell wall biosynthesis
MKKIRILRIINRFNLGGPTYNATFLSAFLSDSFQTKLIGGSHESHEGESTFIPSQYNVEIELIESLQRDVSFKNDRKAYKEIRKIIREFKPHIVHTHASKTGVVGRMAASKEKVPVIIHTFHGHVFHSYFGNVKTNLYKVIERRMARKSDAIIAISNIQKKELVEQYKIASSEKVKVVNLGFDLIRFNTQKEAHHKAFRVKYNIEKDIVAVGIIGRLVPIKNHSFLFDLAKEIAATTSQEFKIVVIGDGELNEELKSQAQEIEKVLGKQLFVFTSWIKNIEFALAGLDLVVLCSLNEGTPVSLIEAQASSVPVISTDVGGVRDIVLENDTGIVVALEDREKYKEELRKMIESKDLREKMSQNGWNHVKDKFSYDRLCSDMEKVYIEALENKGVIQ